MSWYLVVIFSVIILLSFRVGIILSTCSCPNTVQSDHAFGCLNSHCGIKKLSQRVNCCLLRQMCDRNPHRVTHPINLFPLIIEGNWVVISG